MVRLVEKEGAYEDSEYIEDADLALCTGRLGLSYGLKEWVSSSVAVLADGCWWPLIGEAGLRFSAFRGLEDEVFGDSGFGDAGLDFSACCAVLAFSRSSLSFSLFSLASRNSLSRASFSLCLSFSFSASSFFLLSSSTLFRRSSVFLRSSSFFRASSRAFAHALTAGPESAGPLVLDCPGAERCHFELEDSFVSGFGAARSHVAFGGGAASGSGAGLGVGFGGGDGGGGGGGGGGAY